MQYFRPKTALAVAGEAQAARLSAKLGVIELEVTAVALSPDARDMSRLRVKLLGDLLRQQIEADRKRDPDFSRSRQGGQTQDDKGEPAERRPM